GGGAAEPRAQAARASPELAAARQALAAMRWARAETLATAGLAASHASADSADWIAALLLARWRNDHEKLAGNSVLAERAVAIRQAALASVPRGAHPDSLPLALAYEGSAYGLSGVGRPRDAEERAQAALGIRTRHASGPDADILRLQHLLGAFAYGRGDQRLASARFTAELAAREGLAPRDPVEIA